MGFPYEWDYDYDTCLWTKPGLKYTQNGATVTTDYVLSEREVQRIILMNHMLGGTQ